MEIISWIHVQTQFLLWIRCRLNSMVVSWAVIVVLLYEHSILENKALHGGITPCINLLMTLITTTLHCQPEELAALCPPSCSIWFLFWYLTFAFEKSSPWEKVSRLKHCSQLPFSLHSCDGSRCSVSGVSNRCATACSWKQRFVVSLQQWVYKHHENLRSPIQQSCNKSYHCETLIFSFSWLILLCG